MIKETRVQRVKINSTLFLLFAHIYSPFAKKRIVSLSLGHDVHTRLGVAISEMLNLLSSTVRWERPVKCIPKDTISELAGLFSTIFLKCQVSSKEAADTVF